MEIWQRSTGHCGNSNNVGMRANTRVNTDHGPKKPAVGWLIGTVVIGICRTTNARIGQCSKVCRVDKDIVGTTANIGLDNERSLDESVNDLSTVLVVMGMDSTSVRRLIEVQGINEGIVGVN